jgi:hypothetical protein
LNLQPKKISANIGQQLLHSTIFQQKCLGRFWALARRNRKLFVVLRVPVKPCRKLWLTMRSFGQVSTWSDGLIRV